MMNRFQDLVNSNKLFDSHCHLNDSAFDEDISEVVKRANLNDVEFITNIAIDVPSSEKALELGYENVLPTAGIHPELLIPGSDLYDENYNINYLGRTR